MQPRKFFGSKPNQAFHYTHRITLKGVTSLRCPSPRHNAKATELPAYVDIEAVANRLQPLYI